jgi:hypothetical protein
MTGDGDVLQFRAIDEGMTFLGTIAEGVRFLDIEFLVGRTENYGIVREVKVQVGDQFDRSCKPFAVGHVKVTTTLFFKVFERLGEGFRIIRNAIPYSSEINDRDGVIRDNDFFDLLNGTRQILIIMGILGLRRSSFADRQRYKTG